MQVMDAAPAVSIVDASFLVGATWIVPFQLCEESHDGEPSYYAKHGILHAKKPGEDYYR